MRGGQENERKIKEEKNKYKKTIQRGIMGSRRVRNVDTDNQTEEKKIFEQENNR